MLKIAFDVEKYDGTRTPDDVIESWKDSHHIVHLNISAYLLLCVIREQYNRKSPIPFDIWDANAPRPTVQSRIGWLLAFESRIMSRRYTKFTEMAICLFNLC